VLGAPYLRNHVRAGPPLAFACDDDQDADPPGPSSDVDAGAASVSSCSTTRAISCFSASERAADPAPLRQRLQQWKRRNRPYLLPARRVGAIDSAGAATSSIGLLRIGDARRPATS